MYNVWVIFLAIVLYVHVLYIQSCETQAIGDRCAPLKRMVNGSMSWAKLEPAGESTVRGFIDTLESSEGTVYMYSVHNHACAVHMHVYDL